MTSSFKGLERSLGFVAGVTYRRMTNLFQQRLKPYGITPEQWSVLYQAGQEDDLIQKELGERSGKDKPTTTRILDHLTAKGLVEKHGDPLDRRSFLIRITDAGRQLLQDTIPLEAAAVEETKAAVSPEEYETLLELLLRVNRHLSDLQSKE